VIVSDLAVIGRFDVITARSDIITRQLFTYYLLKNSEFTTYLRLLINN